MPCISNSEARAYVNRREMFTTNSETIIPHITSPELYVVYSYGSHYPMYVYDEEAGSWFGNETKSTVTTGKHKSQVRPDGPIDWTTTEELHQLIRAGSYVRYCAQRIVAEPTC